MLNEIVIGCNIEALLFAYFNNLKLYYTDIQPPKWWLDAPSNLNLEEHYLPNYKRYTNLWYYLFFILRLGGNIPLNEQKIIKIKKNQIICDEIITFNKAYIFSDEGLQGLPEPIDLRNNNYLICDYFKLKYTKTPHENTWYNTNNKLANKIYLFNELHKNHVLGLALSNVTFDDLSKEEFSLDESCAFIKWWFKTNNIRGCLNNIWDGKKNYYILQFFPVSRIIECIQEPLYKDTNILKFMIDFKLEDILSQKSCSSYVKQISYTMMKTNKKI